MELKAEFLHGKTKIYVTNKVNWLDNVGVYWSPKYSLSEHTNYDVDREPKVALFCSEVMSHKTSPH